MFRIHAPILIVPTVDARKALGHHLRSAGLAAYREIAVAAKGLEIEYLQFTFFELTLAVCSRVRRDGIVEIEIGLGDPKLPSRTFTAPKFGWPWPLPGRATMPRVAADWRGRTDRKAWAQAAPPASPFSLHHLPSDTFAASSRGRPLG
jgi:hypothetical protein